MSEIIGIIKRAYQRYESGDREPRLTVLYHIANYFCVSSDWLLGLSDDPQYEKYLPQAEATFFNHPDTQAELIAIYKCDKANNPISLAPRFLRACEGIRDDRINLKQDQEPKTF